MKKLSILLLSALTAMTLMACGSKDSEAQSDMDYVKEKGTLIVGITEYPPMDYEKSEGEWVGFDADMAKLFGESLGVDVEFIEIDWDNKIFELDGKTIDCVWNGMTLVDEVVAAMECSTPYCNNSQIVIVPADKADQYQTLDDIKDLTFAVEASSAGQGQAEANELDFTPVKTQADALLEVASGTSDAAIIDALMAGAAVGEGTDYDTLTYTVSLGEEEFGVGFRKGSELAKELNKFFAETYENGTMMELAETYGVQASIIPQK